MKLLSKIFIILFILTNCTATKALRGVPPPDLSKVKHGASYFEVKQAIGSPIASKRLKDGEKLYIYKYEGGRDSSFAEFFGNATFTIASAGLWELTPAADRHQYNVYITYNEKYKVSSINAYR